MKTFVWKTICISEQKWSINLPLFIHLCEALYSKWLCNFKERSQPLLVYTNFSSIHEV